MNFSWLKDLPTKCKETVKVAGEISKEAVKMTGEFIRDNPQLIVKTIASSVAVYYTAKGIAYSKKLEEIRKNYLRECNEKYKNQAKEILSEISSIIDNQNLSQEEISELKSILNQNSEWVFA